MMQQQQQKQQSALRGGARRLRACHGRGRRRALPRLLLLGPPRSRLRSLRATPSAGSGSGRPGTGAAPSAARRRE